MTSFQTANAKSFHGFTKSTKRATERGASSGRQGRARGVDLGVPISLETNMVILEREAPAKCVFRVLIADIVHKHNVNRRKTNQIHNQIQLGIDGTRALDALCCHLGNCRCLVGALSAAERNALGDGCGGAES